MNWNPIDLGNLPRYPALTCGMWWNVVMFFEMNPWNHWISNVILQSNTQCWKTNQFIFPKKTCLIEEVKVNDSKVRNNIIAHRISLGEQFHQYFAVTAEANHWKRNLFSIKTSEMPGDFSVGEQESLTGLSCDETLKSAFRRLSLLDLWKQQKSEYPALADKAECFAFSCLLRPQISARKASLHLPS